MEYKKSELTRFAKDCAWTHEKAVNLVCMSEYISKTKIAKELENDNKEILLEVSKRFAKYTKENLEIDLANGEVQTAMNILNDIISCCEENNWFE